MSGVFSVNQPITTTAKSTNADEVIKCNEENDGLLTLFKSCEEMFHDAKSFDQGIGARNTSGVTNMVCMFRGAASFNQDISGWGVSGATDITCMFCQASSFNQDISK